LGIDISAFLLTSRVLHIRSSEIAKREIPLEEHFDISRSRISRRQLFGIKSFEFPVREISGEENHFGISVIRGLKDIGGKEFEIKHQELSVHEIASVVGSRRYPQPLISLEVGYQHFGISGLDIPEILMTRNMEQ
jgi:hypothetical protein